ncbi:polyprenyl synthetase [Nocardia inohanensis]|uniref:polyprenyl synthetase n=1 Tax=Nocardia inohanensis TaxID=209246 RepID=UPI0008336359|nr:polyprenyl synthetase [Nocardia inohanensis]
MSQGSNHSGSRGEDAVLLAAGLADLAFSRLVPVVDKAFGLLRRSDLLGMAADAERDLKARGRLALGRNAPVPPAHLELLAKQVLARRAGTDDA